MKKLTAEEVKKLAERLQSLAEKLKWHNVTHAQDVLMAADLIAAQGVIALPILEQQERGEWKEWGGTGATPPVPIDALVEVRLRGGESLKRAAKYLSWRSGQGHRRYDIIAYRIIPEQVTNQNGEQ